MEPQEPVFPAVFFFEFYSIIRSAVQLQAYHHHLALSKVTQVDLARWRLLAQF
jgi:hypothetical protein